MDSCDECGFVYAELDPREVSGRLRSYPARYRDSLSGVADVLARRRPEPAVWSAQEYLCHVRDVLIVQRDRVVLAQVEERPRLARMYRDERVELCRYASQDVGEVLDDLGMAAELCALVFDDLVEQAWSRSLVYNWPGPTERDVAWLGRHTVHEAEHHLRDVIGVLGRLSRPA
jgi:S-DNA-T family DNA segregation ATPase FtsK/SpoIIIE